MSFTEDIEKLILGGASDLTTKHESWERVRIGEVANIINGFPFDSNFFAKSGGAPLIRIRDVLRGYTETTFTAEPPEGFWIKAGDVLVGMDGDFNCSKWKGADALLNQRVCKIEAKESLYSPSFLYHVLPGYLKLINDNTPSVTVKHLSSRTLLETPIPLPPLAEQVRIADKLDALLARVEAGRERLERVPKLLKRFRQSVLSAAVSGELTREWRDENAELNLQEWQVKKLGEVCSKITDGAHNTPKIETSGRPFVTAKDIKDGQIDFSANKYISEELHRELYSKCQPKRGDILIVNIGASSGRAAIIEVDFEFSFKNVAILKPNSSIEPKYLLINQLSQREAIFRNSTQGGAQPFLSLTILKNLAINVPPILEQAEIIRRVEALFAIADRIEAKYAAALSSFDRLTPALLAKAFRGELVPQDPNDEPASVLLERIRAAREAEGGKRGRGRPAKAAAGSGDGAEMKRQGRPPGANAQAGAEGTEPKRRGRPPKVRETVSEPAGQPAAVTEAVEASAAPRGRGRPPGPGIPQASSFEDALRKLEEQKLARAQGARQVGLFDDAE